MKMDEFASLSPDEQLPYYEQASANLNLPAATVEKDFWVCWTLDQLFRIPEWRDHLIFKGGTSLSKVWKLIERFSEDIDVTIARDFIGFGGKNEPEAEASSQKQKKKRIKSLKQAAHDKVKQDLLPKLQALVEAELPHGKADWVVMDEADQDNITILFHYPRTTRKSDLGPMLRYVKIELGPRGDDQPSHEHRIKPYIEEALPDALSTGTGILVRVLDAERTFLEKAMLLHEDTFRPPEKPRKPRMARHYYDLYCMMQKGVGANAIADTALVERVREHRRFYFSVSWVDYDDMVPGKIGLVPAAAMDYWRNDYEQMRGVFFFGDPPAFDEIIDAVRRFQDEWNRSASL